MNNSEFIDSPVAIDDLFEDTNGFFFRNVFPCLNHFCQVASIAELGDDTGMGLEGNDLVELDDVFYVGEQLEDFNFVAEEGLVNFSLDIFHVDEFEGQGVTLVRRRVPLV